METEKIPKEGDLVTFEYYTETDVVAGCGNIVWVNDKEVCVEIYLNHNKANRHLMQIGCITAVNDEIFIINLSGIKPKTNDYFDFDYIIPKTHEIVGSGIMYWSSDTEYLIIRASCNKDKINKSIIRLRCLIKDVSKLKDIIEK